VNGRPIRIVELFPGLLFNQGDGGNVLALAWRARRRGIEVETSSVALGEAVPIADIYVIGGAEDEDQALVAARLAADGTLARVVAGGAVVLGVDAGYEILGRTLPGPDGQSVEGVGLLDVVTNLGPFVDRRVVTKPAPELGLPAMSGYESHRGRVTIGPAARRLAELEIGTGNGGEPAADGAVQGNVFGTWLHGPVLPRNVEFADLLLERALGSSLAPLLDRESRFAALVRDERIAEARRFRGA
jgi:CobQ-like glutamine amidotransferase family enzyme